MNVLGADDKYQPGPLVITIAVTAVCWVLTAFLGPQTERRTLVEFTRQSAHSVPAGGACARKPASRNKEPPSRMRTSCWRCWACFCPRRQACPRQQRVAAATRLWACHPARGSIPRN